MQIIHQDPHLLVLNKPSGLLVHRSALSADRDTVTTRLVQLYADHPRGIPRPVHRLDRPTSGLLVCAFGNEAMSRLNALFREGAVKKHYVALCRGWPGDEGESFLIDEPLTTEGKTQEAATRVTVRRRLELPFADRRHPTTRLSLLEAELLSGRFHQIRRHLAHRGYPIAGDTSHGDTAFNRFLGEGLGRATPKAPPLRLALHAGRMELIHPFTGEDCRFAVNPGKDFPLVEILKL